MKRILPIFALVVTMLTSCVRNCGDTSLFYSSGRSKPIVAVLPVIDSTMKSEMHWSLSEEFTTEIQKRIALSPNLYLLRNEIPLALAKVFNTRDAQKIPSGVSDSLGGAEFVVVTEILDQEEDSYGTASEFSLGEVGGLFSIAVRVRVLDVRGEQPKVLLQEVIDHDHVIVRTYSDCDYEKVPWGTSAFERTPMGIAHLKVIKELVAHAEGYIGAVKG